MRYSSAIFMLLFVYLATSSLPLAAQSIHADLHLRELKCNGKTELDDDEIYILIYGKRSNGERIDAKAPNAHHWNMNTGDRSLKNDITLWTGQLGPNESIDFFVVVMEEDNKRFDEFTTNISTYLDFIESGGRRYAYVSRAQDISKDEDSKNEPINWWKIVFEAVKTIYKLGNENTDDVPGVVLARLWNEGGELKSSWRAIVQAEDKGEQTHTITRQIRNSFAKGKNFTSTSRSRLFYLNGDGAKYELDLEAKN